MSPRPPDTSPQPTERKAIPPLLSPAGRGRGENLADPAPDLRSVQIAWDLQKSKPPQYRKPLSLLEPSLLEPKTSALHAALPWGVQIPVAGRRAALHGTSPACLRWSR